MKKNIIFILLLSVVWVGCMKEKGTYAYRDINEVTIDTLKNQTVESLSTLTMEAKIKSTQSSADLTYCWYRYVGSDLEVDTLSLEPKITYKVDLPIGTYDIYLRVTDPKTGISAKNSFKLSVVGKYGTGMMVLGEKDGVANLIFINGAGNLIELYGAESGAQLGHNPVCVANSSTFISYLKDMWVLCDDETGGVTLKALDLSVGVGSKELFFMPPTNFKPESYYKSTHPGQGRTFADFVISNKKLHVRALGASEELMNDIGFNPAINGDYELSKWAIVTGNEQLFYDNKNKRFLSLKGSQMGIDNTFTMLTSTTKDFDPSSVGLELVYMAEGAPIGAKKRGFGLFRDIDNRLYRLAFDLNEYMDPFTSPDKKMTLLSKVAVTAEAVGIDKATDYAISTSKPYLFYCVGSKVYQYQMESNRCMEIYDVSSVPGLENSTVDELYIEYRMGYDGYASVNDTHNRILNVASSQKGVDGRNGSIHVLQLADNGTVESTVKLHKNVCWHTVSITGK